MGDSDSQISLLYVDDESILLESTKQYLEYIGNFIVDTASSAEEGLKKIQEQKYDAVVSDYQMPEMDGLEFLRTLRAEGNTLPFIIFTGRGREEVAIEALNAGADYFLQKGGKPNVQFGELQNFVWQAVEKKRAEGLYQTIFENTGTAMLILEEDGTISHVNEEMEKICGFSREELEYQLKWPEWVAEEDRERMLEFHRLRKTDPESAPKNYDFGLIHKNGEIRTVALTAAVIPGTKKSIISLIDITGQKKAEKQLKFTQFTADHAPEGIMWADNGGRFLAVNEAAIDMLGYSREELLNMSVSHFAPDFPPERFREYWGKSKEKGSLTFEGRVAKKEGGPVTVEISIVFLDYEDQEYGCGFVRDITDRKQAEEAVTQTKRNFETFFNSTDDFLFVIDEQGCFIDVNETVTRRLGYTKAELLGQTVMKVHQPECEDQITCIVQEMGAGATTFPTVSVMTKAGHLIPVEIRAAKGEWDGIPAIFGVSKDISQLKLSEEKFSAAFHSSSALMTISTKQDGVFIEVNETFLQTMGYSREDIIGKGAVGLNLFAFPEDRLHLRRMAEEEGNVRNFEVPVKTKNGTLRYGLFSVESIMVGETPCLLTTMIDITDRKNVEEQLRNTRERLELAMDASENGFWDVNLDTHVIYFSPRYYTMLGYKPGEVPMLISTWVDMMHPDDREWVVPQIYEYVQNAQPYEVEFRLRTKGGGWKWLSGRGKSYEVDDRGIPHRAVGVHVDITDRKQAECDLRELNKKLNLLSSITRHDIINQLSAVMTYEELLKDEIDEDLVRDYLQPMMEATEKIEQIITFTRDYENLGVHNAIWQSVESVVHSVAMQLSDSNIMVKTDTGTLKIFADPMFNKVIYTLFENAARHGGHVTDISVSFHETEDGVVVVIEDNGVGVAGDQKERIFMRGVGSNTGLGLFLTRDILDITGISISETGTEGNGARFEIVVPKGGCRI